MVSHPPRTSVVCQAVAAMRANFRSPIPCSCFDSLWIFFKRFMMQVCIMLFDSSTCYHTRMDLAAGLAFGAALTRHRPAATPLVEQRQVWADIIREPVRKHPKQLAFVSSPAKLKASDKNRRAGGTEGVGRWDLADMIANDGISIEVFVETIGEYSRNWLRRKKRDGQDALQIMESLGMREGEHFFVQRINREVISQISFPWGSSLIVKSALDMRSLRRARGSSPSKVRVDEAQNVGLLAEIIGDIVMASGADYDAEVIFTGTPGPEVDTYFHSLVTGQRSQWEIHHFYSIDNPFFGATWEERYERAVASRIRKFGEDRQLTPDQIEALTTLTESEFHLLARTPTEDLPAKLQKLVKEVNPAILRELFGRWMAEDSQYVHPPLRQMAVQDLCWGVWSSDLTEDNCQGSTLDKILAQPAAWADRLMQLPTITTPTGPRAKSWRALLWVDFGYHPDPFAIWCGLQAPEDLALYEFDAAKATYLSELDQFAIMETWITALQALNLPIAVIGADAGGAEAMPVCKGWTAKLAPIMPSGWTAVEAADKRNAWGQRFQLNAEMRLGKLKLLYNSPTWIEGRYLQRLPIDLDKKPPRKQPETRKTRKVKIHGATYVPGDHCLDALRYAWYWALHHYSELISEEQPVDYHEALHDQLVAAEFG